MSRYEIDKNADARAVPKRIALIRRETSARIELPGDEKLPTAPALLIRELVLFQVVVVFLALMALFFDAPLEDLADPYNTPNPAKAPWYFLGLQELLHYFPPVVAGVVLPGLVVLAASLLFIVAMGALAGLVGQLSTILLRDRRRAELATIGLLVVIIGLGWRKWSPSDRAWVGNPREEINT